MYIANTGVNNVLMYTPSGTTTTVGSGYNSPEGVAANSSDDVIVADTFHQRVTVNPSVDPQAITLTQAIPSLATPGSFKALSATGGGSGNPVVFCIDPATYPSDACSLSPSSKRLKYTKVGTCVISVDQAARGRDAQGNDLDDVTAITSFGVTGGTCLRNSCTWDLAGPQTVRGSVGFLHGTLRVTVALGIVLVSDNAPVTSFEATVGTPIDAAIRPSGGPSGNYSFTRTSGTLPPVGS